MAILQGTNGNIKGCDEPFLNLVSMIKSFAYLLFDTIIHESRELSKTFIKHEVHRHPLRHR